MKNRWQLSVGVLLLVAIGLLGSQKALTQDISEAEKSFQQGRIQFARRNYDAAIDAFKKTLAENSKHAEAYYYLGLAYTRKGRWSQAVPAFRQAIESRDKGVYPEAELGLAGCAYFARDFATAATQCQKAIEQRGQNAPFPSAYNLLGLSHYQVAE